MAVVCAGSAQIRRGYPGEDDLRYRDAGASAGISRRTGECIGARR
jgi:hypothetical protein